MTNEAVETSRVIPVSIGRRGLLLAGLSVSALALAGCGATPFWEPQTREIGFSLWAGVPDVAFGDPVDVTHGTRRIHGPVSWRHPVTRKTIKVYQRVNREPTGVKTQYLTLNADGTALARVYDSRPGQADRYFTGDAFFPLGVWTDGESRTWRMATYQNGAKTEYDATIIMNGVNRTYRGVPGSVRYTWRLTDLSGKRVFDERYDYSPGMGFVNFSNRMK